MTPQLLLFGSICAAVLGYAIQRGSTCLVAAIHELLNIRKGARLLAIAEASIWVAGGLLLVRLAGGTVAVPHPFTTIGWATTGGCLFGIGASINGACAFGTIARLGSGEWAFALTPVGMLIGDLTASHLLKMMAAARPDEAIMLAVGGWLLVPAFVLVAWRMVGLGRSLASRDFVSRPWSAHGSTTVIGVTFLGMYLTVGPWAYTDTLADVAHGASSVGDPRSFLIVALLAGSVIGGLRADLLHLKTPSMRTGVCCAAGGFLMGWGSALIPGGNDGLLLIGMPLLLPYAWVAMAAMAATILLMIFVSRGASVAPSTT